MSKFRYSPMQQAATEPRFLSGSALRTLALAVPAAALAGMLLTLMPAPVFSQAAALVEVDVAKVAFGYRTSKLIDTEVQNDKGDKIGEIDDIIIDKQKALFAIIEVGGFLGIGGNLIAVPYESLTLNDKGDKITLPGGTKEELQKLKKFEYTK